jgi:hypothetical protein
VKSSRPYLKQTKEKSMAQVIEFSPSKYEALNSILRTTKKEEVEWYSVVIPWPP